MDCFLQYCFFCFEICSSVLLTRILLIYKYQLQMLYFPTCFGITGVVGHSQALVHPKQLHNSRKTKGETFGVCQCCKCNPISPTHRMHHLHYFVIESCDERILRGKFSLFCIPSVNALQYFLFNVEMPVSSIVIFQFKVSILEKRPPNQ